LQASSASGIPGPARPATVAPPQPPRVAALRHAALELHKALLDAQRVRYERDYGRVDSSGRFLELVLRHPTFEWLRALSALIARLDATEDAGDEGEGVLAIEDAMRSLVHPEGRNRTFTAPYWVLVEAVPDVLIAHVKLWRLLNTR
jgi:hypothetical protein